MPELTQKITFGEMRESGVRGVLVYCSDYRCSHSTAIDVDWWSDDIRLSDIEPMFIGRYAVRGASTSARTFSGKKSGPTRDSCTDDTRRA